MCIFIILCYVIAPAVSSGADHDKDDGIFT